MHDIKADAYGMKEGLLRGDFDKLAAFMRKSWDAKKRLAKSISNDHIDQVHAAAMSRALGPARCPVPVRRFYDLPGRSVPPRRRDPCPGPRGSNVMTCHFTRHGTEGWKIF